MHSCSNKLLKDWFDGWVALGLAASKSRAWITFLYAVVWTIWETRNLVVFQGKEANLVRVWILLNSVLLGGLSITKKGSKEDLTTIWLDISKRCIDKVKLKSSSCSIWIPPPDDELIFNIDNSARGSPGEVSIGGVLKDSRGKVVCLFSSFIGFLDSNLAELFVLHKACMFLASNQNLSSRKVVIVSDSKVMVSWIDGENFGNFSLVDMVYDIRSFLQNFKGMSVKFMHRGSNSFVDGLAKRVSINSGEMLE